MTLKTNDSVTFLLLAVLVMCGSVAVTWPVRSSVYIDMVSMYLNTISWKDMLNVDLRDLSELQRLCSSFLEWRHVPYVIAFQLLFASFFFRYTHLQLLYEYERQGPAPRAFFAHNCN